MEVKSGNVYDYLAWRGDLSFAKSEFNAVDGLIFTMFSYIPYQDYGDFKGKTLREAITALQGIPAKEKMRIIYTVQDTVAAFLDEAVTSHRFCDIKLLDYVDEYREDRDEQFAAITLQLPDNTIYIAFRGTDDSLVGWKEDFNLAFINGIPSQIAAANYAQKIYDTYRMPLRLGGHSKGGNLSVWAGAHLSPMAKDQLLQIFSFDGPGFLDEFLESQKYQDIQNKILSFIPESSIVGILMGHCDYLVIRSTNLLVFQHDPLSWNIIGNHFEYVQERSEAGKKMEEMVNHLLTTMDKEEVSSLVDKIFDILEDTDAKTLEDLKDQKLKLFATIPKLIRLKKGTIRHRIAIDLNKMLSLVNKI